MTYGYVRVSTRDQNKARQVIAIMTLWERWQRYQKCKTYQKSRAAEEMEQFFTKAVADAKEKWMHDQR